MPAVAVLQDVSRILLTIGVGLFLGYVVLIVSANLLGMVPRYAGKLSQERDVSRDTGLPVATGQRADTLVVSGTRQEETSA